MASVARLNSVALPKFGDKMDPADGKAIWNCFYQMQEQVVYLFQNIDSGNLSDEMRNQYDGMLARLYSLESGGGAGGNGGSLGSSTGEILTRVGALESRAARIEGNMEALTGRVSELEEENKALNEALAALTARVEALEGAPEGGA